jgi:hypothetical protein
LCVFSKTLYDPRLLELVESHFSALLREYAGALPLMNYADLALGNWHPKGGMHKIVEGAGVPGRRAGRGNPLQRRGLKLWLKRPQHPGAHRRRFQADAVVVGGRLPSH